MKILAVLLAFAGLGLAQSPEEQAVLAVVQRLFDAMEAKDAAAARAVVLPEGRYYAVREKGEPAGASLGEFADRLPKSKEPIREAMRDAKVAVRGRIAVVWTPYDFHRAGKRTHGGIDCFSLVKTGEGWKIVSLTYTVEQ